MRTLESVRATPQQLKILGEIAPGAMVIRGAAGSGKTTTAILRLRSLLSFFKNRRDREETQDPVRALVLTFNRTLRGYIADLVEAQVRAGDNVDLEVSTFANWARNRLGRPDVIDDSDRHSAFQSYGRTIALPPKFLCDEVDYVLGRFMPADLPGYISARRLGRGATPRVDATARRDILGKVIERYGAEKARRNKADWNDLAVRLASGQVGPLYDIIIADECQDFSANQLRALQKHLKPDHSLTLIIDSIQRIYCHGFTWAEIGLTKPLIRTLRVNYRNTVEIARFAAPLVEGVPLDEDGTLPDFKHTKRHGDMPVVLAGLFSAQMNWALEYIRTTVDLSKESVAFLHPLGWFAHVREALDRTGLEFVDLTKRSEWPDGPENIALVTLHSAKGLEFDHVFILGLNEETMTLIPGDEDRTDKLRRLLAMGIGRAKSFVCLGYKPGDKAETLAYLDEDTFESVEL